MVVSPECESCGDDLNVNPVKRPNVDWVKVVCSGCGNMNHISMIRLSKEVKE